MASLVHSLPLHEQCLACKHAKAHVCHTSHTCRGKSPGSECSDSRSKPCSLGSRVSVTTTASRQMAPWTCTGWYERRTQRPDEAATAAQTVAARSTHCVSRVASRTSPACLRRPSQPSARHARHAVGTVAPPSPQALAFLCINSGSMCLHALTCKTLAACDPLSQAGPTWQVRVAGCPCHVTNPAPESNTIQSPGVANGRNNAPACNRC